MTTIKFHIEIFSTRSDEDKFLKTLQGILSELTKDFRVVDIIITDKYVEGYVPVTIICEYSDNYFDYLDKLLSGTLFPECIVNSIEFDSGSFETYS